MTAKSKYPWQLYVLSAFLVFLAIRDYMSTYAMYAQYLAAGLSPDDMWNFSTYPQQAFFYLCQHILAVLAFVALVALWSRHWAFPFALLVYFLSYAVLNVVILVMFPAVEARALALGGLMMQSAICIPWLFYVFLSNRAREVFRRRVGAQQGAPVDAAKPRA